MSQTVIDLLDTLFAKNAIDQSHQGEVETFNLAPGMVVTRVILGNLESEEDDYYSGQMAVAWDGDASEEGPGACLVDDQELAMWLHLRWPAPQGQGHGWLAGGKFI